MWRVTVYGLCSLALVGCALPRDQFTAAEEATAMIPGIPDARYWGDTPQLPAAAAAFARRPRARFSYLALSGGGGAGAFGAGFLDGWSETGTRPEFTVVSGVSTGALIAPFAFLGPAYDDTLRAMYTGGYGLSLIDAPDPLGALFGPGVFDSNRLLELSRRFVTPEVIAAIAAEHRSGRRLLVQTTNLDAQRPVIWNMGAIAASGVPGSEELFRQVLIASASVPGVFSPTMIAVQSGMKRFREMHVDGSVYSNVFIVPDRFVGELRVAGETGDIYVIMNGKLEPSFEVVENLTIRIVARSISTMIEARSGALLQSTYDFAKRNQLRFNLTSIPAEVDDSGTTLFDTGQMRKLYAFGRQRGFERRFSRSVPAAGGTVRRRGRLPAQAGLIGTDPPQAFREPLGRALADMSRLQ